MCDEIAESLIEDCEAAALAPAMDDYADAEGARLLHAFESAEARQEVPAFPPELDKLCQKHIHQHFRKQHRHPLRKVGNLLVRAACTALVLLGLCMGIPSGADAFVQPEVNYVFTPGEDFSTLYYPGKPSMKQPVKLAPEGTVLLEKGDPLKGRISEEYKLWRFDDNGQVGMNVIYMTEEQEYILFSVSPAFGSMDISTRNAEVETICLNYVSAIMITRDQRQDVYWADSVTNLSFNLYASDLTREEFLELAEWLAEYPHWATILMKGKP